MGKGLLAGWCSSKWVCRQSFPDLFLVKSRGREPIGLFLIKICHVSGGYSLTTAGTEQGTLIYRKIYAALYYSFIIHFNQIAFADFLVFCNKLAAIGTAYLKYMAAAYLSAVWVFVYFHAWLLFRFSLERLQLSLYTLEIAFICWLCRELRLPHTAGPLALILQKSISEEKNLTASTVQYGWDRSLSQQPSKVCSKWSRAGKDPGCATLYQWLISLTWYIHVSL